MTIHAENAVEPTLTDEPQPELIKTRRGSVEYASFGEGLAVLCLHGAMGGYDQGLILARTLGRPGYRYLSLSRPGYLRTSITLGRSPEDQADLYAALLDSLGIDQTAVMAVSGGGPSAIHFALRHQKRCLGLILVSTTAGPVNNRLPLSFTLMKVMSRLPLFESSMRRRLVKQPERAARRTIADAALLEKTLQNAEAWALLKALQRSTVDRMSKRFVGTENDVAVTCARTYPLDEIAVPTLIVHGTKDPLVPFEQHGKVFAERIPGAELVVLQGGEHTAIFSHRDEARARTIEFLQRLVI